MSDKTYLGDSVYAAFDGFGVVLTIENGGDPQATIVLEPEVIHALDYDRAFREQYQFLPPADALAPDALEQFKKWGEQIHNDLDAEIQAKEEAVDILKEDLDTAKGALEELKREIILELDADIPNLSDIRKLCET